MIVRFFNIYPGVLLNSNINYNQQFQNLYLNYIKCETATYWRVTTKC